MSDKERTIRLIDRIPESKMSYVLGILEGGAISDDLPDDDTDDEYDITVAN